MWGTVLRKDGFVFTIIVISTVLTSILFLITNFLPVWFVLPLLIWAIARWDKADRARVERENASPQLGNSNSSHMPANRAVAESHLEKAKVAADVVNTTTDPETFFKRLHFLIDSLMYLQSTEGVIKYYGMSPTQNLNDVLSNLTNTVTVNDFIDRSFEKELAAALKLKTEKARANKLEKYYHKVHSIMIISNTLWSGSVTSRGAMAHYNGELYTASNLQYLQNKLFAHIAPKIEPSVAVSGEKKSKIVSITTKKWFTKVEESFVAIDIETTGLNKNVDHIVELAAIRFVHGIEQDKMISLVKPPTPIPQSAIDIHHIYNSMVSNAPIIEEVLPKFIDFIGNDVIVGHNVNFDVGFIEVAARRIGLDPAWNYVDTISVAKKIKPGLENYKQATVIQALGIHQVITHRAESDCRACAQVLLKGLKSMSDAF